MNHFGHIDLRVRDLASAHAFYAAILPALGFVRRFDGPQWKVFAGVGNLPEASYFALTEDKAHVANANRIAFWVENRMAVDQIASLARDAGAVHLEEAAGCPEISPSYYATFFEDPSGNRLEVYHRVD
jgi:catechol 2,3-dioxygenase-like lactoylglutathione lyase family enzyme